MQQATAKILFSATDLTAFLACEHLTALDLQALHDPSWRAQRTADDASSALTTRKGTEHERAHLARLRARGLSVVDVADEAGGGSLDDKVARTQAAMAAGVDVVYQATLRDGPWMGHADLLMKVAAGDSAAPSSRFGAWS